MGGVPRAVRLGYDFEPVSAGVRPAVSVVVPTRDRERYLRRAVASALAQQGVDVEVIVVDDGSRDGTAAYLRGLGDDRIVVVGTDESHGVAAARNLGIDKAAGEWVAFLDDDDIWAPDKLDAQLRAASAGEERPWVCAGAVLVTSGLALLAGWPSPPSEERHRLLVTNLIPGGCSGTIAKLSLVQTVGGFDPALSMLADWDLWIRLADAAPWAGVQRPLVAYTVHRGAMSQALRHIRREFDHVEAKYRDVVRARGLGPMRASLRRFEGELYVRARRRRGALPLARSASRPHLRSGLAEAAAAAIAPGRLARLWDRRGNPWLPGWKEEAEGWLAGVDPL